MRIFILAGILALAIGGAAGAQSTEPGTLFISPMGQPFRADEHQTGIQKWFAQADADHDGKISFAEFVADADAFLPHVDANGDGSVISTESTALWRADAPEILDYNVTNDAPIDPNSPGRSDGHRSSRTTGASWGGLLNSTGTSNPRRGGAGRGPMGAQPFGLLNDAEPIMSCDTNFDRRVDKSEFEQCAARRFVELDSNRDGFFTMGEAPEWARIPAPAEH